MEKNVFIHLLVLSSLLLPLYCWYFSCSYMKLSLSILGSLGLILMNKQWLAPKKRLKNKKVLITGACGDLGFSLAKNFAQKGSNLILVDLSIPQLQKCQSELQLTYNVPVDIYACDLSDYGKVQKLIVEIKAQHQKIDILVNNAGIVIKGYIENLPPESVNKTFLINVISHFWLIQGFIPEMIAANDGHIVTISSASALCGAAQLTSYSSSKSAAYSLDDTLRLELYHRGITGVKTTCVCPYFMKGHLFKGVQSHFGLLPILDVNTVSDWIILAIQKDISAIYFPFFVYLTHICRYLPSNIFDYLSGLFGISKSMDTFVGRSKL